MANQIKNLEKALSKAQADGVALPGLSVRRLKYTWTIFNHQNIALYAFEYSAGFYEWLAQSYKRARPSIPTKSTCYLRCTPPGRTPSDLELPDPLLNVPFIRR